jgi:hypothetical protein
MPALPRLRRLAGPRARRLPVLAVALALVATMTGGAAAQAGPVDYFVSPDGSDANSGRTDTAPLRTIQAALDRAAPGTTITLAPGVYRERPTTVVAGTAQAPVTVRGPETGKQRSGRYRAVLFGTSRVFNVNHSHYVLEGFTIDGQERLRDAAYPATLAQARPFKDAVQDKVADGRLVYIGSADSSRDITGVVVRDMFLNGAGGECIRMRNRAHHNTVADSVIQWCGMFGKGDDAERYKYHNGEGVYIGTSPKSTTQPLHADDRSAHNVVRDNVIHTFGSECFNVKENAHDNRFEGNDCRFNDEPSAFDGSNIELRGHANVVADNVIGDGRGVGLKLKSDSAAYDKGANSAVGNTFLRLAAHAIRNDQVTAQGTFCGNTFGTANVLTGRSVGDPQRPCASTVPVPAPSPSPSATPTPSAIPTPTATPTATPAPVQLTIEAESGAVRSPMLVKADGAASGGRYVVQTATSGTGTATYTFTVPVPGTYRLSGRVIAPGGSSNSFRYAFDGSGPSTWVLPEPVRSWTWAAGPSTKLASGTHRLVLHKRERNAQLDVLRLTRVG